MGKSGSKIRPRLLDFEPYCASPIEGYFYDVFKQYCTPYMFVRPQQVIQTPFKKFRMDFLLIKDEFRVGIECDGVKYHNFAHDDIRDALILGSKLVHAMFHFSGRQLVYSPEDCVYALSRYYPVFFSDEGREALACLANPYVRELLDLSKSINYCTIEESSSARYFPDDRGDLERRELDHLGPFLSVHHSFISRNNNTPDIVRAFEAIMIRGFTRYEEILNAYPQVGMAKEDRDKIIGNSSRKEALKIYELARNRFMEYKEHCKLQSYNYLPYPGAMDPASAGMEGIEHVKSLLTDPRYMKNSKFQYITAQSPIIAGNPSSREIRYLADMNH